MNREILELKQELIDSMINYMKVDENDPYYDPEFDAGFTSTCSMSAERIRPRSSISYRERQTCRRRAIICDEASQNKLMNL